MKKKYIEALLDVCDTQEEIDEVFRMAKEYDILVRCSYLMESDVKYFDLPSNEKSKYLILKQMWVEPTAKFHRKRKIAKEVLSQIL